MMDRQREASVEAATWTSCRPDFADYAALIHLLVPGTGPTEWEQFWSALRDGPFTIQVFRDGEAIPLPESAAWAIAETQDACVMVSVLAGSVNANCFFRGGELQLDIDPRQIHDESAFESVVS